MRVWSFDNPFDFAQGSAAASARDRMTEFFGRSQSDQTMDFASGNG
jgi:hypothetical protein